MPTASLEDAAKASYASAQTFAPVYTTIALQHADWVVPVYIVHGTENITATLESASPGLGATVEFTAAPFGFRLEATKEGEQSGLEFFVQQPGSALAEQLMTADDDLNVISAVIRTFTAPDFSAPSETVRISAITNIRMTSDTSITASATYPQLWTRRAPRRTYTADEYRQLIR